MSHIHFQWTLESLWFLPFFLCRPIFSQTLVCSQLAVLPHLLQHWDINRFLAQIIYFVSSESLGIPGSGAIKDMRNPISRFSCCSLGWSLVLPHQKGPLLTNGPMEMWGSNSTPAICVLPFLSSNDIFRAARSASWADIPARCGPPHVFSLFDTTAAPAYLCPSWKRQLPLVNAITTPFIWAVIQRPSKWGQVPTAG